MIYECGEGFNMSLSEIENYGKEVGFSKFESLKEKGVNAAVCYKYWNKFLNINIYLNEFPIYKYIYK